MPRTRPQRGTTVRSAPRRRQSSIPRKSACVGAWAWVPPKRAGHALRRRGIHVHAPLVRPHDQGDCHYRGRYRPGYFADSIARRSRSRHQQRHQQRWRHPPAFAPNAQTVVRSQPSPLAARQVTFQPHTPPTPAATTTTHRPLVAILPSHRHPAAGTLGRGHTVHSRDEEGPATDRHQHSRHQH